MLTFEINLKDGFKLNPNEKAMFGIMKAINKNDGYCPCNQGDVPKEDTKCPCKSYMNNDKCHCNLYIIKE